MRQQRTSQKSRQRELDELMKAIPNILENADKMSNQTILDALKQADRLLKSIKRSEYWTSDEGQAELMKRINDQSERPQSSPLCPLDWTESTKAMLSSAGTVEDEWVEVELCADTGACDTVMPRKICTGIPITPSLQSLKGMEYEVADGNTIPNLGERRCLMWTENASGSRHINMQVADVHKPLLSLSRCADMGFESRFGRLAGALIDEETEEVIPLQRKGNLYVLKCWLKAAPFGRQDHR